VREIVFMLEFWVKSLAGAAAVCLLSMPVLAAPAGKPVETQTIVVPPDQDDAATVAEHAMPAIPSAAAGGSESPASPGAAAPDQPPAAAPPAGAGNPPKPVPTVEYDVSNLPDAVKQLREKIIAAAASGDPEKLRPIIVGNGEPPQLSLNDYDDPITYLKSQSGDPDGREILAILIEVLQAGYVHIGAGTPDEMYVWPYFAEYPVDKLTPPQLVELFRLIYAGDYEDMKNEGTYLFYRIGITPKGAWKYFIAGD
jgi:hypothetical protein